MLVFRKISLWYAFSRTVSRHMPVSVFEFVIMLNLENSRLLLL